ncbi:cytochrome P450 [Pseudonocardia sp. TRM90224]|uniref:cytochrome P450 n=1 Tax=Pseudonocardia sp. TRM90224 TaxID=2812678 RepID=UPI001E48EF41|nr:cytochrome P450 [Pseudonocardia sp. TRM90224]
MTTTSEPVQLPDARRAGCPFDPPPELADLRAERPLTRMLFPDGHIGWLATSHEMVRAVLADRRFSARTDLMHHPFGGPDDERPPPAPPGVLTDMDPPHHTRYRRALTGYFTVRRMRMLTEQVERFTAQQLDEMERTGPAVDLVEAFARPVPGLLICELLGVPYERRAEFQDHAAVLTGAAATVEEMGVAFLGMRAVMSDLVLIKRANPADDLISDLITTTDLDEEELVNVGIVLLGAGLDTTAHMIALGTFALLQHPEQLAALRAEPGLAEPAVEELLRYLTITPTGARMALEDVELGGQTVKAGDTVALSIQSANRDPLRYPDPDKLDLGRKTAGHVAFGHGIHQCLGQQLARVELQVAIPALVKRFPTLRLAVAPDDVPMRDGMPIYGVHRLPVTWDVP